MKMRKTTISHLIFGPTILSLPRGIIEDTTQATIRRFLCMSSFITTLAAMILDLKS